MKNLKALGQCIAFLFLLVISCSQPKQNSGVDYDSISERDRHHVRNALASMEVAEGLEVEVFASEPMMINPTNMDVDHKGRVWICEARNYRLPFNKSHEARPGGDRILIMEDTDGDGRADQSKVFYEGHEINAALGIGVFGNKVIVSASPNIFMFIDDDGDDVADRKEVLFSGISGIDDDHGAHAFSFGPDGRFYFNFGNAGKQICDAEGKILKDKFGRPIQTTGEHFRQGLTFRCKEDGSDLEVLGHNFRNIYEVAVDAYGNLVQSDNDDDGNEAVRINYIIEGGNYGYQDQSTGAGWRTRRVNMRQHIPERHWHLNDPGVIPNMIQTGSGSPTGMAFYEGDLLPEIYRGQVIHGEPGHQVVRAYILEQAGMGYTGSIKNILKSKDKWFRPSDVCIGPDGSLFVSDWYDAVVGGNGMDDVEMGRIYRIAPDAKSYEFEEADFKTAAGAVRGLCSPNMATRYMAWHALRDLPEGVASQHLMTLAQNEVPQLRARALWLLSQLGQNEDRAVELALADQSEEVRLAGIRMARYAKGTEIAPYLRSQDLDLSSSRVRREVALSLQHLCNEDAVDLWIELASHYDGTDRWELEVLGLVTDPCPEEFFHSWIRSEVKNEQAQNHLIWRINCRESTVLLEDLIADPSSDYEVKKRYIRALQLRGYDRWKSIVIKLMTTHGGDAVCDVLMLVDENLAADKALRDLIIPHLASIQNTPEWFQAIASLKLRGHKETLWDNVQHHNDLEIRRSSARALASLGEQEWLQAQMRAMPDSVYLDLVGVVSGQASGEMLRFLVAELEREDLSLAIRKELVSAIGNSWDGQHRIFEMIEAKTLPKELMVTGAVQLMNSWNSELRNKAPAILASLDRSAFGQTPDISGLSRKTGDVKAGSTIFQQHCSTCHQMDGLGIRFGPDLSNVGAKLSKRGLYQAIIYPSASINFGYEGIQVETDSNERYQGYSESETADEMLLRMQNGETRRFSKKEIKGTDVMETSLMTQGLHQMMSEEELVDLVTFLASKQGVEEDPI